MKRNILLLMLCLLGSIGAMAQTKSIIRVATDALGDAVTGAGVVAVGTNTDGKFPSEINLYV